MMIRYLLVVCFLLSSSALGQEASSQSNGFKGREGSASAQRRELTSFWSLLFLLGPSPPHDACGCPHGPIGDHCRHQQGVQYSSQCSASTSTSTSSSTNGYSGDYSTDSASDGSGSSSTSSSSNTANDKAVPEGSKALDPSGFSFWMLIAAAVSAAFAIGAIVVGQRKTAKEPHPLAGSVARRMGLFSNFANSALCSSVERPARVVEMTMSKEDFSMA